MDAKHYIKVEEIDQFFEDLLSKCQQKKCYSVVETAKTMGVTFEELQRWAESNENWAYTLEWCQALCYYHAEKAEFLGQLPAEEAIKYMSECNKEYQQLIQEQEK